MNSPYKLIFASLLLFFSIDSLTTLPPRTKQLPIPVTSGNPVETTDKLKIASPPALVPLKETGETNGSKGKTTRMSKSSGSAQSGKQLIARGGGQRKNQSGKKTETQVNS
ncbi:MAG: hypothetical protein K1Y36_00160 [Blastocatellia bacterium]|nr:hypothetical protein [Blastocatellia bacterium]